MCKKLIQNKPFIFEEYNAPGNIENKTHLFTVYVCMFLYICKIIMFYIHKVVTYAIYLIIEDKIYLLFDINNFNLINWFHMSIWL